MKIKFKRDTAFRKQFFVPESFAHPAKMDAQLLIWIVEHYTEADETILDPMAGMGTTMLACTLGRDVVLVELEEKFCKMMRDNWEQVKMRPQLGSAMGDCKIIQGDARQLEGLLVDKIVSSPPYIAQTSTSKQTEGLFKGRQLFKNGRDPQPHSEGQIGDLPYNKVDKIVTSPPFAEARIGDDRKTDNPTIRGEGRTNGKPRGKTLARYYGEIDKCIFSPPYAGSKEIHDIEFLKNTAGDMSESVKTGKSKGHSFTREARERAMAKKEQGLTDNPENIDSLPYGQIDKIVTSPPYTAFGASREGEKIRTGKSKIHKEKSLPTVYTEEQTDNIGNKSYGNIDSIITSPPYEGSLDKNAEAFEVMRLKGGASNAKRMRQNEPEAYASIDKVYSQSDDNIGNLKSQSYLEAMLQVYQQCFAVLRDSGLMVLVTKNFIRNKQVVRLDKDTIKLCEQAGFNFIERHYRKLPSQSFWRVIYHQKHPDVEQILNEDILVFKK